VRHTLLAIIVPFSQLNPMADLSNDKVAMLAYWETKAETAKENADDFFNAICNTWLDNLSEFKKEPIMILIINSLIHGRMNAKEQENTFFAVIEYKACKVNSTFANLKDIPGYENYVSARQWASKFHKTITSCIELVIKIFITSFSRSNYTYNSSFEFFVCYFL